MVTNFFLFLKREVVLDLGLGLELPKLKETIVSFTNRFYSIPLSTKVMSRGHSPPRPFQFQFRATAVMSPEEYPILLICLRSKRIKPGP
jgi:hypothetical protein